MEDDAVRSAIDEWLAEGPLSVEELAARAIAADLVAAEDDEGFSAEEVVEDLLSESDAYWTAWSGSPDQVVVLVSTLVDSGMTFTHRVTAEEVDSEAVAVAPDLSVLDWNAHDVLVIDDDDPFVADYDTDGATRFTSSPGWIDAARPGDLLSFRRTGRRLVVEIVEDGELGDGAREIEALRDAAAGWIGDGRGEEEVPVVMEAMARDPSLFRTPVPPVGELLTAAGLERRGNEWGWAGQEWRTRQERFNGHHGAIRRLYGFDECCNRAFDRVDEAWLLHLRGHPFDAEPVAESLAHGSVAAAFAHAHGGAAASVVPFAAVGVDAVRGRPSGPFSALLGFALLRGGDPAGAVDALRRALDTDPSLDAAAGLLVDLELDRGDLARAHALAVRTEAAAELLEWIEDERARQAALRPTAGRNDPCPCRSGRKFKQCCLNGPPLALAQRVPLVLQRVSHFATGPDGHDALFSLTMSAADRHPDLAAAIRRFHQDRFLIDVAIHEAGLGAEYLDQRAPLLPIEEVELLEQLLDEPRRLWEIVAVESGRSLELLDTRSGEELTVAERRGSMGRAAGELLLARAGTVDGEDMLFGVPILISLRHRDEALALTDTEADPHELASWFGSLFLPPRITNRDGDDIVIRRTTIELHGDLETAAAQLDKRFERLDDTFEWLDVAHPDADRIVRGTMRLDGQHLTLESNSDGRHEHLLASVADLLGGTVIEDETLDIDLDGSGDSEWVGGAGSDLPDEALQAIEANIREYERRWIDEPVPALGNLTPRQALDDPTRREDLAALLRELRDHQLPDGAVGMSVHRLEDLLGITATSWSTTGEAPGSPSD